MKNPFIPQVRIEPQLRADIHAVLREGETLSELVETTVRKAVEFWETQAEFNARAGAAWDRYQSTRVAGRWGAAIAGQEPLHSGRGNRPICICW